MKARKAVKEEVTVTDLDYLTQVLHPTFIEVDECIFFRPHFECEDYEKYWQSFSLKDRRKVERTLNHVHLSDLTPGPNNQRQLGERIKKVWAEALRHRFPEKDFNIELYQHKGEWVLTLCQN